MVPLVVVISPGAARGVGHGLETKRDLLPLHVAMRGHRTMGTADLGPRVE
jgi:hypothetical protein